VPNITIGFLGRLELFDENICSTRFVNRSARELRTSAGHRMAKCLDGGRADEGGVLSIATTLASHAEALRASP